jgi:AAA domain/Bifunctional DNA primase/polymerase, N-terminal
MRDTSATPSESFAPVDMEPHAARSAMLANGYVPIPLDGKKPILNGWQNMTVNQQTIDGWGSKGNTGMRTAFTPVFDIDILHGHAAQLVEEVVRNHLQERGTTLVRIGLPPKRAIVMRTNVPFKKIIRTLVEPNGKPHKIEILGDGQQVAVAGNPPDTGAPYTWQGGRSPVNTPRALVPLVKDYEAREILARCVQRLRDELGWTEQLAEVVSLVPQDPDTLPPSLEERLAATEYKGLHGLNDAILAMTAHLISFEGKPVADVIEECMKFVRGVWDKIPDEDPDKAGWNWNQQRDQIAEACYGFIKKECGNQPRIIDTLPDWMLKKWREIEERGGTPFLRKRKHWGVEDRGPAEEIPTVDGPSMAPEQEAPGNGERKLRFRLIKFQDMRPGLEPAYLVDELIPSAGLVLVWGKQKTFKSFWLLDLFVHVAMGWPYRDHAVRQGAVIYCAFEGGHGYKGRIEAIRRHYGIGDDVDVPLYVMPGQVDLIADEKALVEEFHYQLGTVVPAVVVLDTLNRSLSGSESRDKDMTLYVKAAEAVRKAFGCLCVIVHHCGYDDTHARGHTSLPAAVDAELSVVRDEGSPIVLVTVKAMRDGPEGMVVRSRALPVPLDPDQNGKPRSSIVITPDDDGTIVMPGKKGGPTDTATPLLVEALRAAIDAKGEYFNPDGKLPLRAADQQHVRELFYRRYVNAEEDAAKSHSAQKNAYKRGLDKAIRRKIVNGQRDDQGRQLLWFVRDEGTPL